MPFFGQEPSSLAAAHAASSAPIEHTRRPITTGTSVLGLVYNGGVMLAADTRVSYGSLAKTMSVPRLVSMDDRVVIGGSGDYSDFQEITNLVQQRALEEQTYYNAGDLYETTSIGPKQTWNYLRAIMYRRRNKMDPLWNDIVVGGYDNDVPFLGWIDKIGTTIRENLVATGFGAYLALPLMRERWRPDLDEGEARALLEDCMRVLFYRDCRSSHRIQLAKVSAGGTVLISDPYELDIDSFNSAHARKSKGDLGDNDGGW